MSKKPTIESLCRKYKNEDVHSHYVTRFSLQIFDALCPYLNLPLSFRPVLKAAALLHDIGYFQNPSDHQAEGCRIVLKKGVAGFTAEQSNIIAAIILLHRKDYTKAYQDPFFRKLKNKETTLRLGAILRVGDGLDHGHIQNVSILSVKKLSAGFLLNVASPGYRGNIAWAQAKTDLWKRVFLKELRIDDATGAEDADKFSGIVGSGNNVLDTARRLLFFHYRIFTEQYDGMIAGYGDEPLHDARVALRRFRACLRLFASHLPVKSCRVINEQISLLALLLSPVRDNDVWRTYLLSPRISQLFRGNIDYVHFCALQSGMKKNDAQTLRGILLSPAYSSLMRDINLLLRVELPRKIGASLQPVAPLAGRRLAALYFEVLSRPGVKKDYDVKKMHSLRKLCRRARYWSEFLMPLLGRPAARFARRFKSLTDVLGDMHDTDMAILRMQSKDAAISPQIIRVLLADKRRYLTAFRKTWRLLRSPSMLFAAASMLEISRDNTVFLYLVRHASASEKNGGEKRCLDSKGISGARTIGRALSLMQCKPLAIASSPLPRSHDTAAIIAQGFSFAAPVTKKQGLLPAADVAATVAWLESLRSPSCICVGHMPHLSLLSKTLLKPGASRPIAFKKASVCCISFAGKITAREGALEWYFSERKLRRIANRIAGKR
jgi:CHAD domain-containing protein/phosphohistidine phosphatase SixA